MAFGRRASPTSSPRKNELLTASLIGGSMPFFGRRPASSRELRSGVSIAAGCKARLMRSLSERAAEIGLAITGGAGNFAAAALFRASEADVNASVN